MLPCSAGPLEEIRLACSSRTGAHSGGGLVTHCLLLYDILSNRCRLRRSTCPTLPRSQAAFKVVTHVKWTAEKLRRDAIPLHEKITALFSPGDEGNGKRFDFYL